MVQIQFFFVAMLVASAKAAVSPEEKAQMLDTHNMYRCMAGNGVPPLVWDDALATAAQSWADSGNAGHSTALGAFNQYGENMHMSCPKDTVKSATDWWYAEKEKYVESDPFKAPHYTGMVWKGTTKIGCGKGKATCGQYSGDSWVCQFLPPGNNPYDHGYHKNVFAPSKTKAQCAKGSAVKLYSSDVPDVGFPQSSAMLGVAAFFSFTGFFALAAGFRRWQASQAATLAASEGLELEPLETGEEGFCPE